MLKVEWTIVCDGCGKTVKKEIVLDRDTNDAGDELTDNPNSIISCTIWNDYWGPGIPDGWIQAYDDTKEIHQFWHDHNCYERWLEKNATPEELEAYKNAVWIA